MDSGWWTMWNPSHLNTNETRRVRQVNEGVEHSEDSKYVFSIPPIILHSNPKSCAKINPRDNTIIHTVNVRPQVLNVTLVEGENVVLEDLGGLEPSILANKSGLVKGLVVKSSSNQISIHFTGEKRTRTGSLLLRYRGEISSRMLWCAVSRQWKRSLSSFLGISVKFASFYPLTKTWQRKKGLVQKLGFL